MQSDVQQYFDAIRAQDPWDALKQSSDRLVAYIASNVPTHYRTQAEAVLRELPENATVEQLRTIANDQDLNGTDFDRFVTQAQAAGAFGDTPAAGSSERAALESWARSVGAGVVRDEHIAQLFRHVDAIVAAEAPGYVAEDTDDEDDEG